MKLRIRSNRRENASTLVMVMVLGAAAMLVLTAALGWTSTNVTLTARNNEYFTSLAAAEAATEKVVAAIAYDFQSGGDAAVQPNIASYRLKYPTSAENPTFGDYVFSDAQGNNNRTYLQYLPPMEFRDLTSQYRGLKGYSSIYRVVSNARYTKSRYNLTAAVWQDIETASIPLFQYAIFYNPDLEINPGANMTVTGPVHGNVNIYADPGATLTFQGDVTASGTLTNDYKPGDPNTSRSGTLKFGGQHSSGVSTLNLPIGTNNTPDNVREVILPPPAGESALSPMGKERFYNKADLIVTVSSSVLTVTSGIVNSKSTTISMTALASTMKFVSTTNTLYNKRENKTVRTIEIDVAKLNKWNTSASNNLPVRSVSGGTKDVTIIYVDDQRAGTSTYESGVLVRNGSLLPTNGLTIASQEPVYVAGDYNIKDSTGTSSGSDTTHTKPAALIGDAVTILSSAWVVDNPAYGSKPFADRDATTTTVNAALVAGIVETTSGQYSGGVENYPRFLEDWDGKTLNYNGSMVVMYPSKIATGPWINTGSTVGIYNPPTRSWAFDQNFQNPAKLPPGTPMLRVVIPGAYASIKPGTTTITDPDALVP